MRRVVGEVVGIRHAVAVVQRFELIHRSASRASTHAPSTRRPQRPLRVTRANGERGNRVQLKWPVYLYAMVVRVGDDDLVERVVE